MNEKNKVKEGVEIPSLIRSISDSYLRMMQSECDRLVTGLEILEDIALVKNGMVCSFPSRSRSFIPLINFLFCICL